MFNSKFDVVKAVLSGSEDIADWYKVEHGISLNDMNEQNVRAYGLDGMGDVADHIIADGIEAGVISQDDAGDW